VKKLLFIALVSIIAVTAKAQLNQNPVSWTFTSKKISDKVYELHLTATIQSGWHLYSQTQPEDAIPDPTKITFSKNPLVSLDGKIKEEGNMEKFKDPKLGSAYQYSSKVDFVQTIKLKANAKTKVGGTVKFQTCDDEKCLPPKTVPFSIAL
jgi:hypothetical protein